MTTTQPLKLAISGGDGIGPEVVAEGLKVLAALESADLVRTEQSVFDAGGERYLRTGEALPDSMLEELRAFDAIYFGAIGRPDIPPGIMGPKFLFKVRWGFQQFANVRPVKLYPGVVSPIRDLTPESCDFVVIRENTEGLYAGTGGTMRSGTAQEIATQESINTRFGVERVLRYAFDAARARKGRLTLIHKANVLVHAGGLWTRTFAELGEQYPDVERDYVHVDAACLYFVTQPERFDVVVTENLFGDILTDLGAAMQGGMGLAASGNIDPTRTGPSMFEPVHGSAPDIVGTGRADPVAAVMSLGMLLTFVGATQAGDRVDQAIAAYLVERGDRRPDGRDLTTSDVGDRLAELALEVGSSHPS